MITVRLFAAAADAAGVEASELDVTDAAGPGAAAATVTEVRAALAQRYGGELARVLERCSILVDGVRAESEAPVPDGATFDVLPPFAGG